MSEQHRNTSIYDIYLDIYEDIFLKKLVEEEDEKKTNLEYYELTGEYLKRNSQYLEMDSKEKDNFIENFDLDSLNKLEDQSKIRL